jgi:hypothetical protein
MSTYALDKIGHRAVIDETFRQALRADPVGTLGTVEPPLSPQLGEALLAGDVGTLSRAGATHFLLVQLARLELFGLTLEIYADRIRAEYASEREAMGLRP